MASSLQRSKQKACLAAVAAMVAMALLGVSPAPSSAHSPLGNACHADTRPTLFADTDAGLLYAIDPTSGHQEWVTHLPQQVEQPDTVSVPTCGDEGYVVTGSGYAESAPAQLVPFNLSTGRLGHPLAVGLPGQVAISPDGRMAYVANSGDLEGLAAPGGRSITPVNLVTDRVLPPINLPGQPGGIALIDHGTKLLVSLMNPSAVVTVSMPTEKVGSVVTFPPTSPGFDVGGPIVIDAARNVALVGNRSQDLVIPAPIVNVLDLRTMKPEQPIDLHTTGGAELAVSPDGKWAFASAPSGVIPIDMATRTAGSAFRNTNLPADLVPSPTDETLYVGQGTAANPLISVPYVGSPITSLTELGGQIFGMAISG